MLGNTPTKSLTANRHCGAILIERRRRILVAPIAAIVWSAQCQIGALAMPAPRVICTGRAVWLKRPAEFAFGKGSHILLQPELTHRIVERRHGLA